MSELQLFPVGVYWDEKKGKNKKFPKVGKGVDWKSYQATADELEGATNIGVVIPDGVLVIDLDLYKDDFSITAVEKALGCEGVIDWGEAELQRTVSGGAHYAFSLPDGIEARQGDDLLGVKGFDTRAAGKGWICTGDGYDYDMVDPVYMLSDKNNLPPLPSAAVDALLNNATNVGTLCDDDTGLFDAVDNDMFSDFTSDDVQKMLSRKDPSCSNSEWVAAGMSVYTWDSGERGLSVWEQWSRGGDNFDEGECAKRWGSFSSKGGNTRTLASLIKETRDIERVETFDEQRSEVESIVEKIGLADERELRLEICPTIRKTEMDGCDRDMLAEHLKVRLKKLTGVPVAIGTCRKLVKPNLAESGAPEWCREWVYVNTTASFMRFDKLQQVKAEAFNLSCGQYIPRGENGAKQSASKFVADEGFIELVDALAYLPTSSEQLVEMDALRYLNTFNHNTVPRSAPEETEEGVRAVRIIKEHLEILMNDSESAHTLVQWMAHQVQYPGKKMLWAPLIQSIQGVGKSFIGDLLESVLGVQNVGVVSASQVKSDFNGWATNKIVNVLQELKIVGENRYQVANALKSPISDAHVQINEKGVNAYNAPNTTNYIAMTNYKDAVPLENSDRRWWITFCNLDSLDDIQKRTGMKVDDYFSRLWSAFRSDKGQIRLWLETLEITAEFLSMKQAPKTMAKEAMIATANGMDEDQATIQAYLEAGGPLYNEKAFSNTDLFTAIEMDGVFLDTPKNRRSKLLTNLGYVQHPTVVYIDGKNRRVWSKQPMGKDAIRDAVLKQVDSIPF